MTQAILDTHEFDRLYSEYKSRFIVIAYALLRDKTLAEDLVTDSFLLLWEKRREIQLSQDEFPAYILGIVRHKCIARASNPSSNTASDVPAWHAQHPHKPRTT